MEAKYDLFISYARTDAEYAEKMAILLKDAGISVWFDEWSLVPGASWEFAVESGIEDSRSFAILIGREKLSSWRSTEINAILSSVIHSSKRIFPVVLPGGEFQNLPEFLQSRSAIYLDTALERSREIVKLLTAILDLRPGDEADKALSAADSLMAAGRMAEAEWLYMRAIAVSEKSLGPDHPDLASRLSNLASLYRVTGRYAEVEPLLKRAIAISEKGLGPGHSDLTNQLSNLARFIHERRCECCVEPRSGFAWTCLGVAPEARGNGVWGWGDGLGEGHAAPRVRVAG